MGIMSCTSHRYNMQKSEVRAATERLITAINGIPVQFRSLELSEALRETESVDLSSAGSIRAHAKRLIAAVEATSTAYLTNNVADAAQHLKRCLAAL